MSKRTMVRCITAALFVLFTLPAVASTAVSDSTLSNAKEARTNQLLARLNEIKATDMSTLTRTEKKTLRKETLEIRQSMKAVNNGVYLSVGAIIIIILLLILIL